MKIYITRHGQVADNVKYYGDPLYPAGEVPLSNLGRKQARRLGEYLKSIGFCGKIYSSPYWRTLETAEIIADIIDAPIIPVANLREIFKTEEAAMEYEGSRIEKLKEEYPHIDSSAELSYPWWDAKEESYDDVLERVAQVMNQLLKDETNDFIIVGHGASSTAVMSYLKLKSNMQFLWNCSLTAYDTEDPTANFVNLTEYLGEDMISNNRMMKNEYEV